MGGGGSAGEVKNKRAQSQEFPAGGKKERNGTRGQSGHRKAERAGGQSDETARLE